MLPSANIMWFSRKIAELQQKPYSVRLRILWAAVVLLGILVIAVWFISLKYRQANPSGGRDVFQNLRESFQKLKTIKGQ